MIPTCFPVHSGIQNSFSKLHQKMRQAWNEYAQTQDFQEIVGSDSSDFMHEINEPLILESKTVFLCEKTF